MRLDIDMISEMARELGFPCTQRSGSELAVDLGGGAPLVYIRDGSEEDSRMGFEVGGWHFHEILQCSDRHGNCIELGPADILTGLAEGTVLICEEWERGVLRYQSLVHRDCVDEFQCLEAGQEVRIRRAEPSPSGSRRRTPEGPLA